MSSVETFPTANPLKPVTRAAQDVDRELRETETSLREKDRSLDLLDAAVSGIGRVVTGFNLLAGLRDRAEKIRLTRPARRRQNTAGGIEPSRMWRFVEQTVGPTLPSPVL